MNKKKYINVSGSIFMFVICVIVMLISFILKMFANLIIFTDKRIKIKIKYNNIIKNNKNAIEKMMAQNKKEVKISDLDVINELGLFNKNEYFQYFYNKIINRGINYYNEDRVEQLRYKNGMYTFKVNGSDSYNVTIAFNKDKTIDYMNCSCPFSMEKGKYCKHMVAALIKLSNDYNIKKLEFNITKIIKEVDELLDELELIVKKNKKIVKKYIDFDYKKFIFDTSENLESYRSFKVVDDDELINIYRELLEYYFNLENHIDLLNKIIDLDSKMKGNTSNELKFYQKELDKKEKYIKRSVLFPIPIIYKNHSSLDKISKIANDMINKNNVEYKDYKFNKQKDYYDKYFDE